MVLDSLGDMIEDLEVVLVGGGADDDVVDEDDDVLDFVNHLLYHPLERGGTAQQAHR